MTSRSNTIRLLHVDDEPDFAETAAAFLERENDRLRVETASNAEEALERLEAAAFDCIVSDYDMPGRTGIEFLEAVREEYPDLPLVLFTGKGSEEVASDAISAGVTDYLQKEGGTDQYTLLANRVQNAVSARQSATEAKRRRHRLEQVLKTVPSCVVQLDRDGQFVFANQRAVDVLGLSQSEVEDRTYNDPEWEIRDLDGDPIPDAELPFRQVLDTGDPLYDARHRIRWPDGTERVLSVNGAPLLDDDGAVESVVFTLTDITGRRERKRDLEVMERRLEAILENTTTPMFMKDDEGRYIFVNHGYREMAGLTDGEIVGRTDHELFPEEMADTVWANDRAVLQTGRPIEVEERIVIDGEKRQYLSTKVPIYDTGERSDPDSPVAVFGVASNITDIRNQEQELQRERDRLGEFASVVSHDLRSPLSVAQGRLKLARSTGDESHLEQIETALDRMERIIDDVLLLARQGRDIQETEPVSLRDAVADAWEMVSQDSQDGTLAFADGREATIIADRPRLLQLLENLLRNSVEHGSTSGLGGSDTSVEHGATEACSQTQSSANHGAASSQTNPGDAADRVEGSVTVTVGATEDGFYVADDGPGVPDDQREALFEAGYSTAEDGSGFGLAIVDRIAEAHGWAIDVTESADGGTRFEITGVEFE
ncbi:MAG: PAS domain-containing protein [Haloarcula sp.]